MARINWKIKSKDIDIKKLTVKAKDLTDEAALQAALSIKKAIEDWIANASDNSSQRSLGSEYDSKYNKPLASAEVEILKKSDGRYIVFVPSEGKTSDKKGGYIFNLLDSGRDGGPASSTVTFPAFGGQNSTFVGSAEFSPITLEPPNWVTKKQGEYVHGFEGKGILKAIVDEFRDTLTVENDVFSLKIDKDNIKFIVDKRVR